MFYFLKHLSNKLAIVTYISVQSEAFQFSYVVSSAVVHLRRACAVALSNYWTNLGKLISKTVLAAGTKSEVPPVQCRCMWTPYLR